MNPIKPANHRQREIAHKEGEDFLWKIKILVMKRKKGLLHCH